MKLLLLWHILIDCKTLYSATSTIDLAGEGQRRDYNLDKHIEELKEALYAQYFDAHAEIRNAFKNAVVLKKIISIP